MYNYSCLNVLLGATRNSNWSQRVMTRGATRMRNWYHGHFSWGEKKGRSIKSDHVRLVFRFDWSVNYLQCLTQQCNQCDYIILRRLLTLGNLVDAVE